MAMADVYLDPKTKSQTSRIVNLQFVQGLGVVECDIASVEGSIEESIKCITDLLTKNDFDYLPELRGDHTWSG